MIVITGAAGFIGSCIASKLNQDGKRNLILVDVLKEDDKWKNLRHLDFDDYLDKTQLFGYLKNSSNISAIIHMGACSSTTERNADFLMENNYRFTMELARYALGKDIRFIYASSAATYGVGEQGYKDDEETLHHLKPMNMYGYSKQIFDLKARREKWFDKIVGLKFFNVYGPNEYFKGDMASVVFKAFNQIKTTGQVKLFKSHREEYRDGEQLRDFIYVKDVVNMTIHFLKSRNTGGVFNIGTGKARSFRDLVEATFKSMNLEPKIVYIDMPVEIRDRYQYFTEADISKIRKTGYKMDTCSLEDGVRDYVQNYLMKDYAHY